MRKYLKIKWGVYSRWFSEEELRDLFFEASKSPFIRNYQISNKKQKCVISIPDNTDYLSLEEQKVPVKEL